MMSYRVRRRAFLTALGGGAGLKIMLRTLEGRAQEMRSPPRLLVTHWPVGIVAGSGDALWKPTSGSVGGSLALKPFADAGLGPDMTVIRGLRTPTGAGGGEEGGMVALVTGIGGPGTRAGETEPDDAYAGGPSFEWYAVESARRIATLAEWMEEVKHGLADNYTYTNEFLKADRAGKLDRTAQQLFDTSAGVIGDPDDCIMHAKKYEEAGCDIPLCLVNPYDIPHEKVMQTIELLGKHVIPEFAD